MLKELSAYEEEGVELTLKGNPASPKKIALECVMRERGSYMSDFIPGTDGRLREISFDYIRRKN